MKRPEKVRPSPAFILYGALTSLCLVIGSPVWLVGLLTGAEKWRSRLGLISVPPRGTANEGSRANKRVWVHASSVGEVRAAARLVKEICKDPATEVVFSTMTAAGNQVARKSVEGPSAFFFLPLDVPYIVGRALKLIQPDTIVLVETELWPYLVFEANRQGIKVVVVNSRVSDRSLRRYALFGFLFREVFGRVHAVMAQNERNALRFRSLGTPPERITVTGNTKQDAEPANVASLGLRRKMGWAPGDVVVTAGSTRPNEEAALCEGFANAKASAPHLRLVLAPRHLGRVDYVSKIVSLRGLTQVRWSRLDSEAAPGESKADVLVLDTIGDLLAAYRESDVAFVGGTLSGHGGHNVLEPAAAGLAMLAGPSRENIEDDANALIERGALKVVDSSRQVAEELTRLAEFREERERSSREALEFYRSRPVASAITLECLRKFGVV